MTPHDEPPRNPIAPTAAIPCATGRDQTVQFLEMKGITKRFPGVLANDHVDFQVRSGEIHALLGENGAGKTTLMRILYGLYQPDEGKIAINGKAVTIRSPREATALGISMVHQHFMLVPPLTVAENVILGLKSTREPWLNLGEAQERIAELGRCYGLRVDPRARVWQLSVGEQQRVEIIKALYRRAELLILDEPTAVLTPQEVQEFFTILRQMARQGQAIIFISHKLHEVTALSDRVTVLRDGQVVGTMLTSATDRQRLAQMMVGREISFQRYKDPVNKGEVALELQGVWAQGDKGLPALKGVSLTVSQGEILGLAGVAGNGQRELAEVIAGLRPATQGKVVVGQKDVTNRSPAEIIAQGMSYVPEERMRVGTIVDFSVAENAILETHGQAPLARGWFLDYQAIGRYAEKLIADFDVKTPSQDTPVRHLSGGNVQKLILARELSRSPRLLVAAQPTRGLDVGATEYIQKRLVEQRSKGTAILLISEDLDEVLALSDRVAVMYEGQVVGVMPTSEASVEELGLLMAGVKKQLPA